MRDLFWVLIAALLVACAYTGERDESLRAAPNCVLGVANAPAVMTADAWADPMDALITRAIDEDRKGWRCPAPYEQPHSLRPAPQHSEKGATG